MTPNSSRKTSTTYNNGNKTGWCISTQKNARSSHNNQAEKTNNPILHPREGTSHNNPKYLGVSISNNLSWNHHIDEICKKANNTKTFLCRNLSHCPTSIKNKCYKTLVRPQVDYASTVWDPHTKKNNEKLYQRRATMFMTNNYNTTSSVTSMMERLEWEKLSQRRTIPKSTMMYRVIHSLVAIPMPNFSTTLEHPRADIHPCT
jgi:hypothetical protein